MATKSFLKTIDIKDSKLGASLAKALFECENAPEHSIDFKSTPKELKGEAVKIFFDSYKKHHADI